ncbi:MAG: hypothetical protein IJQ33_08095 [Clostridia bacterium]|nr:hypothetical protein [Clostridia bacterium]
MKTKERSKIGRSRFSLLSGRNRPSPVQYEEELTLHLTKEELFDRHVLLPHAELNDIVYKAVDQFTDRYSGDHMTLTIFSDAVSESMQHTFREVYLSHYEDEYRKVTLYLYRRYNRVILLLISSLIAYYAVTFLNTQMGHTSYLLNVISNIGVFCIWEIGNTHFTRQEATEERKKIIRARDAEIVFQEKRRNAEKNTGDGSLCI